MNAIQLQRVCSWGVGGWKERIKPGVPRGAAPGGCCAGWMRGRSRGEEELGAGHGLTCPYTWRGSGCSAALRLRRGGSLGARRRSSRGSAGTTEKPRSWARGMRPGNVCVPAAPGAGGGGSASRASGASRTQRRRGRLRLGDAMFAQRGGRRRPERMRSASGSAAARAPAPPSPRPAPAPAPHRRPPPGRAVT